MTITDRNAGYAGLKLGEAKFVGVSLCELFGRTFLRDIWHIGATSCLPNKELSSASNRSRPIYMCEFPISWRPFSTLFGV